MMSFHRCYLPVLLVVSLAALSCISASSPSEASGPRAGLRGVKGADESKEDGSSEVDTLDAQGASVKAQSHRSSPSPRPAPSPSPSPPSPPPSPSSPNRPSPPPSAKSASTNAHASGKDRHPRLTPAADRQRHTIPRRPTHSPLALDVLPPFDPNDDDGDDGNASAAGTHGPSRDDAPITLSAASIDSAEDYIIKLHQDVEQEDVHSYIEQFNKQAGLARAPRPRGVYESGRNDPTSSHPNCLRRFLDPHTYRGVVAKLTPECLKRVQRKFDGKIDYIERNGRLSATVTQNPAGSWGLSRISSLKLTTTKPYYYPAQAGLGVRVFVLDTGIQANHSEFGTAGRARMLKSFVEGEEETDMDGHGTHVAATIGGIKFGVAKRAWIYGVKVLDKTRSGTYADIVAGIQYAAARVLKGKTVLNLSISGPVSQAVNDALTAAVAAGIVVVGAAGNDGQDACNYTPGSATNVVVVGATDNTDTLASFSNYGRCVSISAPGKDIRSAWAMGSRSTTGTAYMSGTSQACPHVSGIAALYLSMYTYPDVATLVTDLVQAGNWNRITAASLKGSPNVLAYNYQDPQQPLS